MNKPKKLIWHIYLLFFLIIVITLITILVYVSAALKTFYLERIEHQLEAHAQLFRKWIEGDIASDYPGSQLPLVFFPFSDPEIREKAYADIDRWCKTVGAELETRITLILPSGRVIGDTMEDPAVMNNHADRPEIQAAMAEQIGKSKRYSYTLERDMMYVALPVTHDKDVVQAPLPVVRAVLSCLS